MVEKQKKLFRRHTLADAGLRPQEVVQPNPAAAGTARLGQVGILLGRTLSMIFTARTDKGESWKMAYRFTNGSLTFILISMSFVGMIMVYQSTEQMARYIGETSLVGASFLKSVATTIVHTQWLTDCARVIQKAWTLIGKPDNPGPRLVGQRLVLVIRQANE